MRTSTVCLLVLLLGLGPVAPMRAGGEVDIELAGATDYIHRGYSQTDRDPTVQAGVGYRHDSGFFVGGWASRVRYANDMRQPDRDREVELRGFLGYGRRLGAGVSADVGVARYEYPRAGPANDLSYDEFQAGLQFRGLVFLSAAHAPDWFGTGREATFFEVATQLPLPGGLDLGAGVGHAESELRVARRFNFGHVSLGRGFGPVTVEVGFFDSDAPDVPRWGHAVRDRWVARVAARWTLGGPGR